MAQQRAEKKDRYFVLHHYMLKTDAWRRRSISFMMIVVLALCDGVSL